MKYTENNINFNNVRSSVISIGVNGPICMKPSYSIDADGNIKHRNGDYVVNAIDIHWNGAELQNITDENLPSTLTSTAQLLVLLDNAYKTINSLQSTIDDLNSKYEELANNLKDLADNI